MIIDANKAIKKAWGMFDDWNNKYGWGPKRLKNVRPKPIYNHLLNDAQKNNPNATIDHRNLTFGQKIKALAMNDQGEYSKARIAGMGAAGYMGASAAGRIISGGGLYKDADGNTDIIGIPFI